MAHIVRDDLHKKAPVPPRVQRVFKLALRKADRLHPDHLVVAAQTALDQAMRQGCSADILDLVTGRAYQGELFGPIEGRRANSPLEAEVLSSLACNPEDPRHGALRDGLDSFAASWVREIRATIVADGTVPEAAAVISAIANAFERAADNVMRNVCANETLTRSIPPVQLDENLLPEGWSAPHGRG